ncbi:hypothetical protein F442_08890 [Phytophthora nicotianae P10297]|uniref:Uncharacterized protein n=3 Tax=Phytophthora nicotianae TaxID=4792 RepID=V9F547_PHYNI|nr:hypothetical protein F443_08961 [Phytophthora nicotianae P1569]ETM46425.1 hypothetical protein L914_08665 [Phytophthora nicotianae]ETP44518.1 hypothetical protein F442_08890 [Phytophthora nicotianae P10297]
MATETKTFEVFCEGVVRDSGFLLEAVEALIKAANKFRMRLRLKTFGLFHEDLNIKLTVDESCFNVHLFNLIVEDYCKREQQSEDFHPYDSSIALTFENPSAL